MGILGWIIFGFVVGLIARALLPGKQPIGFVWTTLLGIAGSVIGGIIANALGGYPIGEFHASGWIGSIIGAFLLLLIYVKYVQSRPTGRV